MHNVFVGFGTYKAIFSYVRARHVIRGEVGVLDPEGCGTVAGTAKRTLYDYKLRVLALGDQ